MKYCYPIHSRLLSILYVRMCVRRIVVYSCTMYVEYSKRDTPWHLYGIHVFIDVVVLASWLESDCCYRACSRRPTPFVLDRLARRCHRFG